MVEANVNPDQNIILKNLALIQTSKELERHPKVTSIEERLEFVRAGLEITYDELAEVLPSNESGEIDQEQLAFAFSTVSFLQRSLSEGILPSVVRRASSRWQNRTMLEVFQAQQTDLLLGQYVQLFSWNN